MVYSMAIIKCRSSRGYKPETKQVSALAMYNLAMTSSLQELLSIFGLLIGPHASVVVVVVVVTSSHVAVRFGETGKKLA